MREHIFIHAERPADKLGMLVAMMGKLLALVAGLCGEDNADALSHHEVLLPAALLSKFVSDKLAECLAVFKRQVSPLNTKSCPALDVQGTSCLVLKALLPIGNPAGLF